MTPMSNSRMRTTPGSKRRQRSDAPLAHRRPGYSLSGCVPAEPDSASPGSLTVPRLDACRNHSWTSEQCLEKSHPHGEVRATSCFSDEAYFKQHAAPLSEKERTASITSDAKTRSGEPSTHLCGTVLHRIARPPVDRGSPRRKLVLR
jgi:hypothetical protein